MRGERHGSPPSAGRIVGQVLAWAAVWALWIIVSRNNHPTLRLNVLASFLLMLTFAAAVYANHLLLIPRLWSRRRFAAYAASLLGVMGLLALACTAAIHLAYDGLWGPDPARFGFLTNLGMESGLVAFHVLAAAVVLGITRRLHATRRAESGR
ncbi:hypothetical protein OJF2_73750 [Aquisphaera giovannonii]|uniref:Uncharacterized protein n=1 Tax=Aquisphaera giovannonii TaxID=406548 RepID=A0A5B9WEU3_9BACT|nr:hypothetical protein [Aquisphaera giovannonii]QEH38769.1 hypothetical protein OJF2_73750 [Aquisphaera giovannonii]